MWLNKKCVEPVWRKWFHQEIEEKILIKAQSIADEKTHGCESSNNSEFVIFFGRQELTKHNSDGNSIGILKVFCKLILKFTWKNKHMVIAKKMLKIRIMREHIIKSL